MGESHRDAGGEGAHGGAGQESQSRPSVESLLVAFQEASRRRSHPSAQQRADEPGSSRRASPEGDAPEEKTPPPDRGPESVPEPEPTAELRPGSVRSPVKVIEETMAAFRKAERRAAESRARGVPAEEEPGPKEEPRAEKEPSGTELPEETPGGRAGTERAAGESETKAGSAEDLAPAFRRVLSERSHSEPTASEEVPEEGGHGGEGPPPSPAGSSRPEATYLWVTDPSGEPREAGRREGRAASVSVGRLSEPRAAEAEAFLLRGGGERPYRLLKRIRGHPDPAVYLKPVFWRHGEEERSPVSMHVDGEWTGEGWEGFDALQEEAAEINHRVRTVLEAGGIEEGGVELRVLRFVATRNQEFIPRRTEGNGGEFVYPKLTPLLQGESQGSGGELAQILSKTARRIRKR